MRVTNIKNRVLLRWFGDELYKEIEAVTAKDEKEAAERIHRLVLKNTPIGSYRRRFRKTYKTLLVDKSGKRVSAHMKPYQQRMPGRLKASVAKFKSKYKDGGWVVSAGNYLAWYKLIVEYGTKQRRQKTTGRFTGKMKAVRYLRKALANEKARFIRNVKQSMQTLRGMNS